MTVFLNRNIIAYHYLRFNSHFSRLSWYQNISILDFVGAKDDGGGGDNWNYKVCQNVTSNKPTPSLLQARCPSCHPTNSVLWHISTRKIKPTVTTMPLGLIITIITM